jgi:V8-like Glu-specific endopeptidase
MSETDPSIIKELVENYSITELANELDARQREKTRKGKAGERRGLISTRGIPSRFSTRQVHDAFRSAQTLVYGVDDRQDYYQLKDQQKKECDSVVSLWEASQIQDNGNGESQLQTAKFADELSLCENERFREQPIGAFCSGFLVGPDLIVTAGHCVKNANDLTNTRFVFGYRMEDESQARTTISNSDIYKGKEIVGRRLDPGKGSDWCIVRLDRPVENHSRFENIRKSGKIPDSAKVHVIGHPVGLPLKYAGGAWVRDNQNDPYVVCNLDTYGGNSGSPVINDDEPHEIEGILVRGDTDFKQVGDCQRSNVCPNSGCSGEDVTRATEFADNL